MSGMCNPRPCPSMNKIDVLISWSALYLAQNLGLLSTGKVDEQVTRGHNIVADGWAGASNPPPHPKPPPTLKHTQKVSKMLDENDKSTDQWTDGLTDGQSLL